MNPDQIYKISVDLGATGNVFKKGHIIRLEVSSSNFPRFDRNLNTGADQATSRQLVSATNTILHDAEHPSAVLVPVTPARAATPRCARSPIAATLRRDRRSISPCPPTS